MAPEEKSRPVSERGAEESREQAGEKSDRAPQRDKDIQQALQRVVAAADSYASAVKTMHSFPPQLPLKEANELVETAFSELRSARGEHLFSLLEAAAGARGKPRPQEPPPAPPPRTNPPEIELLMRLTAREREIVTRVAEGMRSKEIAHVLGISPKTVVTHRSHIMDKLGVHDSTGIVRFAIRVGLCKP